MDRDYILALISEIEKELKNLDELRNELATILTDESIIIRRSKGSILHDFYNCCERIFKRIVSEINGGYDDSERWHKALLFKMTIPIKGVRPAVISEDLASELDEYLAFRHVFRNIYGFELKGERLTYLSKKFHRVSLQFSAEINKFLQFLNKELKKKKK